MNDNKVEINENKNPKKKEKKSSFINLKIICITNGGKSHRNEKQSQNNKGKSYVYKSRLCP